MRLNQASLRSGVMLAFVIRGSPPADAPTSGLKPRRKCSSNLLNLPRGMFDFTDIFRDVKHCSRGWKGVILMDTSNLTKNNLMIEVALRALELDLHVIPLQPNGTDPLIEDWDAYMYIYSKKQEIIGWWEKWPTANIGVLCGLPFGIDVVETNIYNGPLPSLERKIGSNCIVSTSKKVHFYYGVGSGLWSSFGELPRGINVYGFGYYVPIPPSRVDGLSYNYLQGSLADARTSRPPLSLLNKQKAIDREKRKKLADASRGKYKETRLF